MGRTASPVDETRAVVSDWGVLQQVTAAFLVAALDRASLQIKGVRYPERDRPTVNW